jgi:hypothetical protein
VLNLGRSCDHAVCPRFSTDRVQRWRAGPVGRERFVELEVRSFPISTRPGRKGLPRSRGETFQLKWARVPRNGRASRFPRERTPSGRLRHAAYPRAREGRLADDTTARKPRPHRASGALDVCLVEPPYGAEARNAARRPHKCQPGSGRAAKAPPIWRAGHGYRLVVSIGNSAAVHQPSTRLTSPVTSSPLQSTEPPLESGLR